MTLLAGGVAAEAPEGVPQPGAVPDVRDRVVSGAKWVALTRWSAMLVSWPATIVIARVLVPADYGYVALVAAFSQFAGLLAEGGISSTVVLGRELTQEQYRRLHGWSISFFVVAAAMLAAAAIPLEWLYDKPGLRWVAFALLLNLVMEGLILVPVARMRRAMQFRRLGAIGLVRVMAEAATGVTCALSGLGYWSLVAGVLAGRAVEAALIARSFYMLPLFPRLAGLQDVLASARRLLVASVSGFLSGGSDAWIGAAVAGTGPLGGYAFMKGIAWAPLEKVSGILVYVSGSFFGNVRDDPARLKNAVLSMVRLTALIMLPAFAGMALVAQDLVAVVFGERWTPYVTALQVYCVYAAILPLTSPLYQAAVAVGASGDVARASLVSLLIMPPAFYVLGSTFGATGLAMVWLLPLPLVLERLLRPLVLHLQLRRRDVALAVLKPVLATGLMGLAVEGAKVLAGAADVAPALRLAASVVVGCVSYIALSLLIQRRDVAWLSAQVFPPRVSRHLPFLARLA